MDEVELIKLAATRMRQDEDPRWHPVAELISGGPLSYAKLRASQQQRGLASNDYPDADLAVAVAHAFLEEG